MESPVKNPLHPTQSEDPVAFLYTGGSGTHGAVKQTFGTPDKFPYIATTYRLTEHEHYVTQHVPLLAGLQPFPFVEIPEGRASQKGIKSGDRVRVRSKQGQIEVLLFVAKRLAPFTIDGQG